MTALPSFKSRASTLLVQISHKYQEPNKKKYLPLYIVLFYTVDKYPLSRGIKYLVLIYLTRFYRYVWEENACEE